MHTDALGVISLESGKTTEALDYHRRQLELLESAEASNGSDPRLRQARSVAYHHVADVDSADGDFNASLDDYRRSLALRESLVTEFPNNNDYTRLVGVSHFWIGDVLAKLHRTREALDAYRRSLEAGERLARGNPAADAADLTYAIVQVGNMLGRLGRHGEALGYYRRAESVRAASVHADGASLWKQASLIEVRVSICSSLAAVEQKDASATCAAIAAQLDRAAVPPDNAGLRTFVADCYAAIGDAYSILVRHGAADSDPPSPRQARDMYKRSVDVWIDLSRRGVIAPGDAAKPAAAAQALARAEAALHAPS